LSEKETKLSYYTIDKNDEFYKINAPLFQEAYNRYKKRNMRLALSASASIQFMANNDCENRPDERCREIEEVIIVNPRPIKTPNKDLTLPTGDQTDNSIPGSDCGSFGDCLGGGGGGGGTGTGAPQKIDVEQLKDYPCAYALAQQLPNMKNDIAKLLKDTFGKDNGINVTFKPADLENADGGTDMEGDINLFKATISLDKGMLTQATQEYILATMYHEVVHAYLLFEQTRLGVSGFNASYPGVRSYDITMKDGTTSRKFEFIQEQNHNRMGPFINGLKDSILKFSPNYPPERAEALAMWGIITEASIPKGYASINAHERESSTAALGKKCKK
ncbi:hypothetical protein M2T82_18505, partial [Elizabethkingia ursingii]|uniref:hypothetical protein n=1 Tax=Elizabethkingia ursingii TaxID=1756150 RepID=UPI002012A70C